MSPKADAYEIVTNKLIESLEQGTVPWDKPWKSVDGHGPTSMSTGKQYRGINVWILSIEAMLKGYTSPYWVTFKQARELAVSEARREGREIIEETNGKGKSVFYEVIDGEREWFAGGVRKGETGTQIVLWKRFKKTIEENGVEKDKAFMMLRHFTVFNVAQCDGVTAPEIEEIEDHNPIEAAEKIVSDWTGRPTVNHGGNRACYMPAFDIVQMPERGQFDSPESYYNVLFHELAHSTGHESRLKRPSLIHPAPFGSEDYSKEELVAEFAAAFLTGEAGIEVPVTRSASYLANWLKVLKDDRKMLVSAAAQAQKAADLVLGIDWEEAAKAATPEAVAA